MLWLAPQDRGMYLACRARPDIVAVMTTLVRQPVSAPEVAGPGAK